MPGCKEIRVSMDQNQISFIDECKIYVLGIAESHNTAAFRWEAVGYSKNFFGKYFSQNKMNHVKFNQTIFVFAKYTLFIKF